MLQPVSSKRHMNAGRVSDPFGSDGRRCLALSVFSAMFPLGAQSCAHFFGIMRCRLFQTTFLFCPGLCCVFSFEPLQGFVPEELFRC